MCGCFEINFKFIETFNYSEYDDYNGSKYEFTIQHLLIVGSVEEKYIIKHWRQDWLYQNTHLYEFVGDKVWKNIHLEKKM